MAFLEALRSSFTSTSKDAETEAWNLLDALDWGAKRTIKVRLSDGSPPDTIVKTAPKWIESSTFQTISDGRKASWEDLEIPHFPNLILGGNGQRTSEPVARVEETTEQDLLDLVTIDRLKELLDAPMGMIRFTEFVHQEGKAGSAALLRYYKDIRAQCILIQEVQAISQGLHVTYFDQSDRPNEAFNGFSASPIQWVPALSSTALAMNSAQEEALDRLYTREFKRFISGKITDQASACLGSFTDHMGKGNLGEIYCLADPRQHDTPLVYVSDGFCQLSEYPRSTLIARNCRFLQGPGTDADAVRLLRDAIRAGKEHTSLLLNYTRTGTPFWNLLTMIPLKNAHGGIDFFLGAQINVTRALTSRDAFEALTGMAQKSQKRSSMNARRIEFSEDVLSAAEIQAESLREDKSPVVLPRMTASQPKISPLGIQIPQDPLVLSKMVAALPNSSSTSLQNPQTPPTPTFPDRKESHGKFQKKWFGGVKSIKVKRTVAKADNTKSDNDTPILQEVEASVKEDMANFASVYSKIILFRASDRKVTHITPALLAYLGYPIKSFKDRHSPSLVGTDILSLLADNSASGLGALRQNAAKSIGERSPISFFTGLKLCDRQKRSIGGEEITEAGSPFTRVVVHLTPVKDIKDIAVNYVLVVG